MSEEINNLAMGELRLEEPSEVKDSLGLGKDFLSVAVDTPMPQSPPFEILSPQPSSTANTRAMAATVEDCEDTGDYASFSSSGPAPILVSPSVTSPSLASPSLVSPSLTNATTSTATTMGSNGSSKTVSRDRPTTREKQFENSGQTQSPKQQRPGALTYLDTDSPGVTPDAIHKATRNRYLGPRNYSPPMKSPSSSTFTPRTEVFSEHSPDDKSRRSWSPPHTVPNQSPAFIKLNGHQPPAHHPHQPFPMPYGTPEMGRGNSNIPHFPPGSLPPQFQMPAPMGPPRGENLPPSGYQLLAAKLAGGIHGPPVRPIYRRFEALNHRILLHLQDELAELEEQLHGLDVADTQNRQYPGGIFAASRRQESLSAGELFVRKTDILGKVGFKLSQYNHVLASFKETQEFSPPNMGEIHDYRSFLAAGSAVVPDETRFLDATDLVSLACLRMPQQNHNEMATEDVMTPMPRPAADAGFPPGRPMSSSSAYSTTWRSSIPPTERIVPATLAQLALAMFVALLVPILTFAVIPAFAGRMTVVLLVGLGVAMAMVQSGLFKLLASDRGILDGILYAGVYGGIMAVIAGTFG